MRNACIVILMFLPCLDGLCNGKLITAGLDAGGYMKGLASIQIGYGFSAHLSAHAEVIMNFTNVISGRSDLEKEHDLELGKPEAVYSDKYLSESIHIRYWTREMMSGPYIMTGIRYSNADSPFCEIGIGYRFRIWKGIGIETGYMLNLTDALRGKRITGEGFTLGLCYTFNN